LFIDLGQINLAISPCPSLGQFVTYSIDYKTLGKPGFLATGFILFNADCPPGKGQKKKAQPNTADKAARLCLTLANPNLTR